MLIPPKGKMMFTRSCDVEQMIPPYTCLRGKTIGQLVRHKVGAMPRRSKMMMPHNLNEEQYMAERTRERQRELDQRHLLASLRQPRRPMLHGLIENVGTVLVTLGIRMQRFVQSRESVV